MPTQQNPVECPHCYSPAVKNEDGLFDGEYECGRIAPSPEGPEFRSLVCKRRQAKIEIIASLTAEHGIGGDEILHDSLALIPQDRHAQVFDDWNQLNRQQQDDFIYGNDDGTIIVQPNCPGLSLLNEAMTKVICG